MSRVAKTRIAVTNESRVCFFGFPLLRAAIGDEWDGWFSGSRRFSCDLGIARLGAFAASCNAFDGLAERMGRFTGPSSGVFPGLHGAGRLASMDTEGAKSLALEF